MADIEKDFVHFARLVLSGKAEESKLLLVKAVQSFQKSRPDLAKEIKKLLMMTSPLSVERSAIPVPLPVDSDSRLELLKREIVGSMEKSPIWSKKVASALEAVVQERTREVELMRAGLHPTRSLLLVGPPGVGKTMSAKWLAQKLDLPLLTLDLAAVMSSYLGKTGNNIRVVLDYAKRNRSVLLLDEFDAIAKRRDDAAEVGELKRLVTVILQSVDEWPTDRVLLAATNHPELLDPAVWRRFDRVVEFQLPDFEERFNFISTVLEGVIQKRDEDLLRVMSAVFEGTSFAEIEKQMKLLKRNSVMSGRNIDILVAEYLSQELKSLDRTKKLEVAKLLDRLGFTQRKIHDLTGHSRDTLREHGIGKKRHNQEREM